MNSDELRYKPTGYSYRVEENVRAGEYPVWEWEQGARMRQLKLLTDFGINPGEAYDPYDDHFPEGYEHIKENASTGVETFIDKVIELCGIYAQQYMTHTWAKRRKGL